MELEACCHGYQVAKYREDFQLPARWYLQNCHHSLCLVREKLRRDFSLIQSLNRCVESFQNHQELWPRGHSSPLKSTIGAETRPGPSLQCISFPRPKWRGKGVCIRDQVGTWQTLKCMGPEIYHLWYITRSSGEAAKIAPGRRRLRVPLTLPSCLGPI